MNVVLHISVHLLEGVKKLFNFISCIHCDFNRFLIFQIFNHAFGSIANQIDGIYDFFLNKDKAKQNCCQHNQENRNHDNNQEFPHIRLQVRHIYVNTYDGYRITVAVKYRRIGRCNITVDFIVKQIDFFRRILLVDREGNLFAAIHIFLAVAQITGIHFEFIRFQGICIPNVNQIVLKRNKDIKILNISVQTERVQKVEYFIIIVVFFLCFDVVCNFIAVNQSCCRFGIRVCSGSAVFHFFADILISHNEADNENQNRCQHGKTE